MKKAFYSILVILFSSIYFISCEVDEPLVDHYIPVGDYSIMWDDLPVLDNGKDIRLGGFTAIFYKGDRTFYAISSRGPVLENSVNSSAFFLLPDFVPEVVILQLQDDHTIKVAERIKISSPMGKYSSGRSPSAPYNGSETILNDKNIFSNDSWGINPGGFYFDRTNNFFYFADKYNPGLFQVTVNGEIVKRLRPGEGIRNQYITRDADGGFNGLDMDRNGNFLMVMKKALQNKSAGDAVINYNIRRISNINPKTQRDLSMFYFVEPESRDGVSPDQVSIGDIKIVNDTSYLVTEFGKKGNSTRNLLFLVTAPDSVTKALEGFEGINSKTFETLSPEEWSTAKLIKCNKYLLQDLSSSGISRPESLEIIDAYTIAIMDNNNFGITDANPQTQSYQLNKNPIQLKIIKLSSKLNLKR